MEIIISRSTEAGVTPQDFSVLSLNQQVSSLFRTAFPYPVWLRGEIAATPRPNSSGHAYFQLVEPVPGGSGQPLASISCTLFRGSRQRVIQEFARAGLVFDLEEGMNIRALGRVSLWDAAGKYQFIIEQIDPSWQQADQIQYLRKLVDKLGKEGVLRKNGELPFPSAPLKIGLITSKDSAAHHDFMHGLRESGFPFEVFTAWGVMQGTDTASSITAALNRLSAIPNLDVAVITRGGGSSLDLAWFNDEGIARTISQMPCPVISGIGHEIDTTLPDFAAHTKAKTPTHAADILVNAVADIHDTVESLSNILQKTAFAGFSNTATRISTLATLLFNSVGLISSVKKRELHMLETWILEQSHGKLQNSEILLSKLSKRYFEVLSGDFPHYRKKELQVLINRLQATSLQRLDTAHIELKNYSLLTAAVDPQHMYRRGWAAVRDHNGYLLKSVRKLQTGEHLQITLSDGKIQAITDKIFTETKEDNND